VNIADVIAVLDESTADGQTADTPQSANVEVNAPGAVPAA
jgi:hypothetical protein